MWTDILFDLDGTLTDSGQGIINSVTYALRTFGVQETDPEVQRRYVGPPLDHTFHDIYGFSDADTARAIDIYREYFAQKGMFENAVYPGIAPLLHKLGAAGRRLYVATSKPEFFAVRICDHFDLTRYFVDIAGAPLDHGGTDKADVINALLQKHPIVPQNAVMIGDRMHDVEGAHKAHLACIGVLYGYGTRAELEDARAEYIAEDVSALGALLEETAP